MADHERDLKHIIGERLAMTPALLFLPELLPMIRSDDSNRIFEHAPLVQGADQHAERLVVLGDLRLIKLADPGLVAFAEISPLERLEDSRDCRVVGFDVLGIKAAGGV